jgi:hypothetical protein
VSIFVRGGFLTAVALCVAMCQPAMGEMEVHSRNLMAKDGEDANEKSGASATVVIVGAQNGTFSGKAMISGAGAGLKATAGDLKAGDATIPSSRVQVRYAAGWPEGIRGAPKGRDMLLESPLGGGDAAVEAWITVSVPKDAKAGTYTGQVTFQGAAGKADAQVSLRVCDWAMPDTQGFRTWTELIQSPDTLSLEYEANLWSPRHWDVIARSLALIGQTGSRVLYVPLICRTNNGNAESMVRWVRRSRDKAEADATSQPGLDSYAYDFSVMDKYLDLAVKHMGAPKLVIFNVWECYQKPQEDWDDTWWNEEVVKSHQENSSYFRGLKERADETRRIQREHGAGPAVTVAGAAGAAKTDIAYLPSFKDPSSKALWKPLFAELRARMAARGLEKAMMLGMQSDARPTEEEVASLNEISGGLPWAVHSHQGHISKGETKLHDLAPIGYEATVFAYQYTLNPAKARTYGWKSPGLATQYVRFGFFNTAPGATIRHMPEINISGMQRGVGRIGADTWPAARNKSGARTAFAYERFPECQWRNLDVESWLLAPGPQGPVGTVRLEFLREGVEECEARIFIEDALTTASKKAKLGDALAAKAQSLLDERQRAVWKSRGVSDEVFESSGEVVGINSALRITGNRGQLEPAGHKWFVNSGWQKRGADLYDLAGEVARALGK